MAYAILTLTIVLSGLALPFWIRFVRNRIENPIDMADAGISDWPVLISFVLPRPARRLWHGLLLLMALLMAGGLHFVTIGGIWSGTSELGLYICYFASLGLWLTALCLPALVIHSHRLARERDGLSPEDGGR